MSDEYKVYKFSFTACIILNLIVLLKTYENFLEHCKTKNIYYNIYTHTHKHWNTTDNFVLFLALTEDPKRSASIQTTTDKVINNHTIEDKYQVCIIQ